MYSFLLDAILVSFGASLGSFVRFKFVSLFNKFSLNGNLSTIPVNLSSSFLLGLLLPFVNNPSNFAYTRYLTLFIAIGFLGSLSTFSSFIMDLYKILSSRNLKQLLFLSFCSLFGGLVAISCGYYLGSL